MTDFLMFFFKLKSGNPYIWRIKTLSQSRKLFDFMMFYLAYFVACNYVVTVWHCFEDLDMYFITDDSH